MVQRRMRKSVMTPSRSVRGLAAKEPLLERKAPAEPVHLIDCLDSSVDVSQAIFERLVLGRSRRRLLHLTRDVTARTLQLLKLAGEYIALRFVTLVNSARTWR